MAKEKKSNKTIWIIGIIALFILFYGGNHGWFKSISNTYTTTNQIPVPTIPISTNAPNQQVKTCAEKAQEVSAYFIDPVPQNCLTYGTLDCQDKGQEISGWALDGTCCMYTCVKIVMPVCTDTDGGQDDQFYKYGTCESSVTQSGMWDQCINGQLWEQYCGVDATCQTTKTDCPAGSSCVAGACVVDQQQVDPNAHCAASCLTFNGIQYHFTGGTCYPYNPQGATSMAATCTSHSKAYVGATGCSSGNICCCR